MKKEVFLNLTEKDMINKLNNYGFSVRESKKEAKATKENNFLWFKMQNTKNIIVVTYNPRKRKKWAVTCAAIF